MITIEEIRSYITYLPETEEHPHFEKVSFRIKKKIFTTIDTKKGVLVAKLTLADQSVFSAFDKAIIYPVPGAWGKHGWTMINMKQVRKNMCKDVIQCAYGTTAPKTLLAKLPGYKK